MNALSLYAVQGLNYLMPLVVLPFLLRALTAVEYGTIVFAQSLMGYGLILTEFGFNFTAARDISIARDNPAEVAKIYWVTTAAKIILLLISSGILCAVILLTPRFRNEWPIFAASGMLLLGNVAFPQWYFQGLERLKDVAAVQAIAKCVVSGAVILFVRSSQDVLIAALILSLPQLIGAAAAVVMKKSLTPSQFYRPTFSDIARALSASWHLFSGNLASTLYLQTTTIVLGLVCGAQAVANFSVPSRIVSAVRGLTLPITQSVFPRFSRLFAVQRNEAWHLLRQVGKILLPAMAVIGLVIGVFAPLIIRMVAGDGYREAVPVLRIMAVLPVLVTSALMLAQLVMVNTGLSRQLSAIYMVVGVASLMALIPLIRALGTSGAAVSLVIAEACGPILMGGVIWRKRNSVGYQSDSRSA
jgi:PST family polysaccharide transporter